MVQGKLYRQVVYKTEGMQISTFREVPIGDDNYLLLKAKEANYQEIYLRRNEFE